MSRGAAPGRGRRALTLFELAVVLLIAGTLVALIGISAQGIFTRTTVSRIQHDHQMIARALENYMLDYGKLPPAALGLEALTRPTAYLGKVPVDPFQDGKTPYLYLPVDHPDLAYILVSPGPNGRFDMPAELKSHASPLRRAAGETTSSSSSIIAFTQQEQESLRIIGQVPGAQTSPPELSEVEMAILRTYLILGRYDPEKGGDGDIIHAARH